MQGNLRVYCGATLQLLDGDFLEPGGEGRVLLLLHDPESWADVEIGEVVGVYEGPRAVGSVTVTSLL
jgi:hypothetical protein